MNFSSESLYRLGQSARDNISRLAGPLVLTAAFAAATPAQASEHQPTNPSQTPTLSESPAARPQSEMHQNKNGTPYYIMSGLLVLGGVVYAGAMINELRNENSNR